MLIAIIIGFVVVSITGIIFLLRAKRKKVVALRKTIRSLTSIQVELYGRFQTMIGRHRAEAIPINGPIERRSRELSAQAQALIEHAETRLGMTDNSMYRSLKQSWTDVEENLSSAFVSYNRHVADYNSTLQMAPASLLAKLLRYQKEPLLN
jgi:hypothetical protein